MTLRAKKVVAWCAMVLISILNLQAQRSQRITHDKNDKRDGTAALQLAVRKDDLEQVRHLIRKGANARAANHSGITPISLAATNGNAAMIELLLQVGADPNDRRGEGESVLMTASRSGNPDAVKVLLAHGADVNVREAWYGQTALMWAAAENHAAVVQALIDKSAEVNARSNVSEPQKHGGMTPLLFAARQGALDAALVLISSGADVNMPDPDGITPIALAIRNGHYDVAEMLLDKGANVNAADASGRTPLYVAVDVHTLESIQNRSAPKPFGRLDSFDMIKLLLGRGANPNARLNSVPPTWKGDALASRNAFAGVVGPGTTPFIRAAKNLDLSVMKLLLEKGADPNLTTDNRTTALMAAIGGLGVMNGTDIHVTLAEEDTAIEVVKFCLDRGADINVVNRAGQTAMQAAIASGANRLVHLLADRPARTPLDEAHAVIDR